MYKLISVGDKSNTPYKEFIVSTAQELAGAIVGEASFGDMALALDDGKTYVFNGTGFVIPGESNTEK